MDTNSLAVTSQNRLTLMRDEWSKKIKPNPSTKAIMNAAHKDARYRVGSFVDWLDAQGGVWVAPDLAAYRDYLLQERKLSPAAVTAHLSTIRGRYRDILDANDTRELLYSFTPGDASAADKKAYVDEYLIRLENAVKPNAAKVTVVTKQDRADSEHLRLTAGQVDDLLNAPGIDTLQGIRDTALLALMVCTGVREAEAVALHVDDLRQNLGGAPALHVRAGKGSKARLIPYGELAWCLDFVDVWLQVAGIESGFVFRGFYKGGKSVRSTPLTTRAVQLVLEKHGIVVDGKLVAVKPHDLRRTYARRLYEAGTPLVAIQQNLGHADVKTTLGYIGTLDADTRKPPKVYKTPRNLTELKRRREL